MDVSQGILLCQVLAAEKKGGQASRCRCLREKPNKISSRVMIASCMDRVRANINEPISPASLFPTHRCSP